MVATLVQILGFVGLVVGAGLAFGAGGWVLGVGVVALLVGEAMDR